MSELPDLPRQIVKREASVTPRVLEWFRTLYKRSCAIEVKCTDGNSIPKSALMEHQRLALLAATGEGIVHKLSDEARRKQPFDAFQLVSVPAYVVACFTKHRKCLVIPVEEWRGAKESTNAPYIIRW